MQAALQRWREKLLDLSKRNRLLNFGSGRATRVTAVDELPTEVFRQLVAGDALKFRHLAPEPVAKQNSTEAEDDTLDPESVDAMDEEIAEFVDYDVTAVDERHRDEWLQTRLTREQLDKALRRLADVAKGTIEEQGVNTLFLTLGCLHYGEPSLPETQATAGPADPPVSAGTDATDRLWRAPLLLVPVQLTRTTARAEYVLSLGDDDPLVNPAIAEYLRQFFGLTLPELPDDLEGFDPIAFFTEIQNLIEGHPGWRITNDIVLCQLGFAKLVMYKDLERHAAQFASHPIARQLGTRGTEGTGTGGLPADVTDLTLDRDFPPEDSRQVVDADSSQLRAIAAVAREHSLVIEGPPGTGKSQTITNLIAQALGDGQKVLFVAEKMAALEVVHSRLRAAGLGDFCLELHSQKANKRAVAEELARCYALVSEESAAAESSSGPRLAAVRNELAQYVRDVHTPYGALDAAPYEIYGSLGAVLNAPKVRWARPVGDISRAALDQAVRALEQLAQVATGVGDPRDHPWRDTKRTYYSESLRDEIEENVATLLGHLADFEREAGTVSEAIGFPAIRTCADAAAALEVAEVMARSPGAPITVLMSEEWNAPPHAATELVAIGRLASRLSQETASRFTRDVLETDHASDIAFIEQMESRALKVRNWLDRRYRTVRRRWLGYRLPSYRATLTEQAGHLRAVDTLRAARASLAARAAEAQTLFGALWHGESSDWDALDAYISWVVQLRATCVAHGITQRGLELAASPAPDVGAARRLAKIATDIRQGLATVARLVEWPDGYLQNEPVSTIQSRLGEMANRFREHVPWAAFVMARDAALETVAAEFVALGLRQTVRFGDLPGAFLRSFYRAWLDAVVEERVALRTFHTMTHEQRVAEFRRLDERVLVENRERIAAEVRQRARDNLLDPELAPGLRVLKREMRKQRAHRPLRQLMASSFSSVTALKPCVMMSPLTVAQMLDATTHSFDLVVFDEASQLPSEDAVGAIARGKRLVVVGDQKQLPPTDFFAVQMGQVDAPIGEDGDPLYEDAESVLEELLGIGLPSTRLRWHYRSRHESLIAFSNANFYGDLFTFPSPDRNTLERGLQFEKVEDGVYEGRGVNRAEARRVADAVVAHIKSNPDQTLGVATFSQAQQQAIKDEIELRRRQDPSIEFFFGERVEGEFFVKNLENVQGDDRDVIFISVAYGRDANGRFRHNFGPINGTNGWRRLNVLVTRARLRLRVFSSVTYEDIDLSRTSAEGARLLREYLRYAETGQLVSEIASVQAEMESPFEVDVHRELTLRGLRLIPQVGVAGYRIDFGVIDEATPGRFRCGIECDGAMYHSAQTVRDRDRLRQQVLEGLGWTIHRVWSTDWFKDRQGQIERLVGLVNGG